MIEIDNCRRIVAVSLCSIAIAIGTFPMDFPAWHRAALGNSQYREPRQATIIIEQGRSNAVP